MHVKFEGVNAISGVDLTLEQGEILGLIGPNGAGKTTLVNVLTGFQKPSEGRVFLEGEDITGVPAHRRATRGLSRTFQGVRLFEDLTVLENAEAGGVGGGLSRRESAALAWEALELFGLEDRARQYASALPAGEQRLLGIARAVCMKPRFLVLDEPAAGLDDVEAGQLVESMKSIRDHLGCGIVLIEHDMRVAMGVSERVQVLDSGRTIAVGEPEKISRDPIVIDAYLGVRHQDGGR